MTIPGQCLFDETTVPRCTVYLDPYVDAFLSSGSHEARLFPYALAEVGGTYPDLQILLSLEADRVNIVMRRSGQAEQAFWMARPVFTAIGQKEHVPCFSAREAARELIRLYTGG
jgi:hypothetical protein